ncbi:MAG: beta-lactamase family protein [Pirellulales bacterium]|nr:beta-lactamase family protein [Pirellulales bacterium]
MRVAIWCSVALLCGELALCIPVLAAAPDWQASVDAKAQKIIDQHRAVGLVIGLLHTDGRRETFAYGHTRADAGTPDAQTIFEIGSITKTMTTLVLAELVTRGELTLDTPVKSLLPADYKVPRRGDREITLLDLATHTSGLPNNPPSIIARLIKDPKVQLNPFAAFDETALRDDLGQVSIEPQSTWPVTYSNFGMGLLGYALCRKTGLGYEAMIRQFIGEPLQLPDTHLTGTDEQRARRTTGHTSDLQPCPDWDFQDTSAGAGAIRSTLTDMLQYLAVQCGQVETTLRPAMRLAQEQRYDALGVGHIGLGWFLLPGPDQTTVFTHNGGTNGQATYAAYCMEPRVGVVVLCNTACPAANDLLGSIGARLIRELISAEIAAGNR